MSACPSTYLAIGNPEPDAARPTSPGEQPTTGAVPAWEQTLLSIAQRYPQFRLASPEPAWAIASCRLVSPGEMTGVPSRSDDQRTHGSKIYKLWVSDFDAYKRLSRVEPRDKNAPLPDPAVIEKPIVSAPVGLTLVKETFESVEVPRTEEPKPNPYRRDLVVDGDRAFRQGAPAELFIMTKLDPKTPDTDNGWVYAVVSTDCKSVLRSGRIESCMNCHEQTTRDRLYGPEDSWPKDKDGKAMLPIVRPASAKPTHQPPAASAAAPPEKKAAPTMVPPKSTP
jgi:hypothetical protein